MDVTKYFANAIGIACFEKVLLREEWNIIPEKHGNATILRGLEICCFYLAVTEIPKKHEKNSRLDDNECWQL